MWIHTKKNVLGALFRLMTTTSPHCQVFQGTGSTWLFGKRRLSWYGVTTLALERCHKQVSSTQQGSCNLNG